MQSKVILPGILHKIPGRSNGTFASLKSTARSFLASFISQSSLSADVWEGPWDVVESAGFQVTNEGTHLFRAVPFIMTVPSWDEIMQCLEVF